MLGVEQSGLQGKDIAAAPAEHPATATGWVMRGSGTGTRTRKRAARLEGLKEALSRPRGKEDEIHVPGTGTFQEDALQTVRGQFRIGARRNKVNSTLIG